MTCELWYGGQIEQNEGGREQRMLKMESKWRLEIQNEFDGKRDRIGPALLDFGLSDQSNPEVIQPERCCWFKSKWIKRWWCYKQNNKCGGKLSSDRRIYKLRCVAFKVTIGYLDRKVQYRDFPGGSVVNTPGSQCRGARVQSLVRELDPTCHN